MFATALWYEFLDFCLGFEPTSVPNQYRMRKLPCFGTKCNRLLPEDRIFTLVSHDARYALPHPILLETHCILAAILHATGRLELDDSILEGYWDT